MPTKDEFVDQLISKLPVGEYCLFIVRENEKFSGMTPDQKMEAFQKYKGTTKHSNFQKSIEEQWRKYFLSAYDCGLFKPKYHEEILSRIEGLEKELLKDETNQFRGALAVCCACYVLHGLLGFQVLPRLSNIKNKRSYDLDVSKDNHYFKVEVKAPERELQHPPGQGFSGDDAEQLRARIFDAIKQGADFVCIISNLTTQMGKHAIYGDRERLINAVCTNYKYPKFLPEFAGAKAILTVEQRLLIVGDGEYDHSLDILLMENPSFYDEIAPIVGSKCVHLIKKEDKWLWSDGEVYGFEILHKR